MLGFNVKLLCETKTKTKPKFSLVQLLDGVTDAV